jgi:hypothetical protein
VATNDGMELRYGVPFVMTMSDTVTLQTVDGIELTPFDDDAAPRPSVVLRRAYAGEKLWDIAKKYRTTIADIQIANQIDGDVIAVNKMLLIPKKR